MGKVLTDAQKIAKLRLDIDTARKNLNSHDWKAVDMHDSLCQKCNGSILNVTLVFACEELLNAKDMA